MLEHHLQKGVDFEQTQIETESNSNRIDDRADLARVDSDFDGVSVLLSARF